MITEVNSLDYSEFKELESDDEFTTRIRMVKESELFDAAFYLANYPDVALAGCDPLEHYVRHGLSELRQPSRDFDPRAYLAANPDVAAAGINPFLHYVAWGQGEGRQWSSTMDISNKRKLIVDSGLFDPAYYLAANPEIAIAGLDPLEHYLTHGGKELRQPSLDFDPRAYLAANPDIAAAGIDPTVHYIEHGRAEGRPGCAPGELTTAEAQGVLARIRASKLFDETYYLEQCPLVRDAGVDPLLHYLVRGFRDFLEPSPTLSMQAYVAEHPDVRGSGRNPLLHLVDYGREEGHETRSNPSTALWRVSDTGAVAHDGPICIERMAGVAFFSRFGFSFESSAPLSNYFMEAVEELARKEVDITIDCLDPDVSIIIPIYGELPFVLSCLDSLSRHRSRFTVEIVIVDDASAEHTETRRLEAIPWIRYRRLAENVGFLVACNQGVEVSRGRFIVLLNSDTRVAPHWLDELIGSFDLFGDAGLVGSKLFNSDGTLQEAGGIYWRDGGAANYGRDDDPNRPKYCFARRVDYCSGAAVALPKAIWQRMAGFDRIYEPAYCEDADLAFRLRDAGFEVWFQSLAHVLHYEGKTHGRDINFGVKACQRLNMRRLWKRWRSTLAAHSANGGNVDLAADRSAGDRVLVIDAITPTPDRDSGSFITWKMLLALRELGFQISFVPQHSYAFDNVYTANLQRIGVECFYAPYVHTISDVLDLRNNFDVVLAYRYNALAPIYEELRKRLPTARIIFHNVDLHYLREEREAALLKSRSRRIAAAATKTAELRMIASVDCTIVHTSVEATIIRQDLQVENIIEFPYIAEVHSSEISFGSRHDLMFLGGFRHTPNIDAVIWFIEEIWPELMQNLPPETRFVVVGDSPPAAIERLASERVVVTGYVPDLKPYFDRARVAVAPLRYGAGIKGKVVQSLCFGVPTVVTPIAAEGIGLTSGQEALIAQGAAEIANCVVELYHDEHLWTLIQEKGYTFVENNFSWDRCLQLCTQALDVADNVWLRRHEADRRRLLDDLTRPK